MKRIYFLITALLLMLAGAESAKAQKVILVKNNDEVITYKVQDLKYIMFEDANPDEHEWVDLALPSGTLWATTNVGANSPEDYGDYFAWGEITPKEGYTWGNYVWMTEGKADWNWISKYTFADGQTITCWYSGDTFIGDGKKELEPDDDAATKNWGKDWRMPTKEQFNELIDASNTTSVWTMEEGIAGLKITSLKNGKSIFLPATGYYGETGTGSTSTTGNYWARTLSLSDQAFELFIKEGNYYCYAYNRYLGQSVRPVRKGHDFVDLGLPSGTMWATCNVGAESPEEIGDKFAWGETEPKEEGNGWETYKYCKGSENTLTKYCLNSEYGYNGFTDNLTELLPEDDAATANWGSNWQMPSIDQVLELLDETYTTSELTTQNGVFGLLVTSKSKGSSIFLPANDSFMGEVFGNYWERTLNDQNVPTALVLYFYDDYIGPSNTYRYCTYSVRPVLKK